MITLIKNSTGVGDEVVTSSPADLPTVAPLVSIEGATKTFQYSGDGEFQAMQVFWRANSAIHGTDDSTYSAGIQVSETYLDLWGTQCFLGMSPEQLRLTVPTLLLKELNPNCISEESARVYQQTAYLFGDNLPLIDPRFSNLFTNAVLLGIFSTQAKDLDVEGILTETYLDVVSEAIAMQILTYSNLGNFNTLTSEDTSLPLRYFILQRGIYKYLGGEQTLPEGVDTAKETYSQFKQYIELYISRFKDVDESSVTLVSYLIQMVMTKMAELSKRGNAILKGKMQDGLSEFQVYRNVAGLDVNDLAV